MTSESISPLPLTGVRILDFTRILSGPYCTLLLHDLGADVIKIEKRGVGDDTRGWGPPFLKPDISTYFAAMNRGKRSLALDFRAPGARALLASLIPHVDVVVENFRPGVMAVLGLDRARLDALNPRVVSCSISGFGAEGAYADLPGTEIVVEAMSGLMDITGPIDGEPVRFGIAMVDIATGLTASTRILAALLQARATGRGAHLDCSLYATALGTLGTLIASYTATGARPTRWGSHHPTICPYGGFPTADGTLITGAINDAMWPPLCDALELAELNARPDLVTNAARVEHRAEVEEAIARRTVTQPTAYWLARLRARGLLGAPVRTVGQAVDDPATRDLGLLAALSGHAGVLTPRLDNAAAGVEEEAPRLGQHTREILREVLSLPPGAIDVLLEGGVVHTQCSGGALW